MSARKRAGTFFAAAVVGALLTVLALAFWKRMGGQRLEALTRKDLQRAEQLWHEHGPADYQLAVRVDGPQPALYEVQVEDRQVVSAQRNGKPLTQRRTWETWSVPGMFETIATDFERREDPQLQGEVEVRIRAHFHPGLGYPQRYLRVDSYARGNNLEVTWEVERFVTSELDRRP